MPSPATRPDQPGPTTPRLHLAHPPREGATGWPHGLFDRLFEAWAERAHRVWTDRGWCGSRNAPYL